MTRLIMALIMGILTATTAWAQNYTDNNVNYYINGLTAFVANSSRATGAVTILSSITVNSTVYPVTSIEGRAFNNSGITSITIPSSVTTIGGEAFMSSGITSITIPSSVTTIGAHAFKNCTSLQTVTFDANSSLTTIESNTFLGSGITSITIPKSVTTIQTEAFYD